MKELRTSLDASGKTIVVVATQWNELIVDRLVEGALSALEGMGDPEVTLIRLPGAWEIPPVIAKALRTHDAAIALGCVLQGETPHAKLLAADVGSALMKIQTETGKPIGWGILTPDDESQALSRAGLKHGNKGREAAQAVVESLSALSQLGS